jgi:hypothetical protein
VCDFIIHPESLSQCLTKPAMLDTALILVSILPTCGERTRAIKVHPAELSAANGCIHVHCQ